MQQERNRVIEGMQEWKQKEQMIADLFSPGAARSRYVQQLKLEHLRGLRKTIGTSLSKDERIVLRVLQGEIAQMERQLYPNLFVRLSVRLQKTVHNLLRNIKKVPPQIPEWKMKVEQHFTPKQKQEVKQQQKAGMRSTLVQKKKVTQRKSMKIAR